MSAPLTFTFTAPGLWEAEATTLSGNALTARAFTICDMKWCPCPKWAYEVRLDGRLLDRGESLPTKAAAVKAARDEASWLL